jgi:cell division protein FtsB
MPYLKRTNIPKNILLSRGAALAVIFLIIFVGFGVVSITQKSIAASRDRKLSEVQAADLKQKNDDMARKLAELNTDNGKEAALREQFPVVKPGEHVIVITDQQANAVAAVSSDQETSTGGGFWNFVKNIFKGK